MNGKATRSQASDVDKLALGNTSVFSAAQRSDGTILVGTPRAGGGQQPGGKVSSLKPTPAAGGGYTLGVKSGIAGSGPMTRVGMSVAVGSVTSATAEDFVVVGDSTVQVLGDEKTPLAATASDGSCAAVQLSDPSNVLAFRPVAVGDLLTGGFDEIVLSGPAAALGNQREVVIVEWNGTAVLPCPTKALVRPGPYFGTSLAVGDFDGDGKPDLAVGSPPDKVYVYFGPLGDVTLPLGTVVPGVEITNASITQFGQNVAAFGFPKRPGALLMVSDPGAAVGDRAGAGKVYLFSLLNQNIPGTTVQLANTNAAAAYFDSNQDAESGVFGSNLGSMIFNTGLCSPGATMALVPWASNNIDVLAFFGVAGSATGSALFRPQAVRLRVGSRRALLGADHRGRAWEPSQGSHEINAW